MNVEVRVVNSTKGRGVFATRDIKNGNIIFEEDAFVCCQFSWNAEYKYLACDHCMKPLESAQENAWRLTGQGDLILPYPDCCTTNKTTVVQCHTCGINYCSEECRDKAFNQYHRILCINSMERNGLHPLEQLNDVWKNSHYPPETSTIMIIPRILATIIQSTSEDETTAKILQFCHTAVNENEELVHKLLGEKFIGQLDLLHRLLCECFSNEKVSQFLTPEGFRSLLALIGTNGQGVGTSAISQWVNSCTKLPLTNPEKIVFDSFVDKLYENLEQHSGTFLNNEGVALYTLQSCCNHSCAPNAEPNFLHNNSKLSLVATRDIAEGEEISISYLDECILERSRHSRHKILKENYLFICNCSRCIEQAGDPDVTSEEEDSEEEMSE